MHLRSVARPEGQRRNVAVFELRIDELLQTRIRVLVVSEHRSHIDRIDIGIEHITVVVGA